MFIVIGVFARVSAIAFLAPGLGERAVSVRVRLAAAAAITIILTPLVYSQIETQPNFNVELLEVVAAEATTGLLFGFALRLLIFTLQIAGSIIAQHVSLSQLFGPNVGFDSESPYTAFLLMGGIAVAVSANLHFYLAGALVETYGVLPFGQFPVAEVVGEWTTERTGLALHAALALAAPFVILGFIYSLALAAASRAMPQLMAAFVGAPAITLAGMTLFAVSASVILMVWLSSVDRALFDLFGVR